MEAMREVGTVVELSKNKKIAKLSFSRKAECENCGMCLKKDDDMKVYTTIANKLNAKVGDEVVVEMKAGYVLSAAFVIYIIPLILSGLTLIFTKKLEIWKQLAVFFSILVSSFGIVILLDRYFRKKKDFAPHMVKILYRENSVEKETEVESSKLDEEKMGKVINATSKDIKDIIAKNDKVLVDFWATWCPPCKMLGPVLEKVAADNDKAVICKIDVDQEPDLAAEAGVSGVPTMIFYKKGKEKLREVGFRTQKQIQEIIDKL